MAFFPFNRKSKKTTPKSAIRSEAQNKKSELTLKLEAVTLQSQEILEKTEEARRRVEDIPKLLEERKRREHALIKDRARNSKTLRGLDKSSYRLPSVLATRRMTRIQERAQFTRFLLLCAVLGGIMLLLWRTAR
jgi:hypothetical protein